MAKRSFPSDWLPIDSERPGARDKFVEEIISMFQRKIVSSGVKNALRKGENCLKSLVYKHELSRLLFITNWFMKLPLQSLNASN